MKHEVKVPSAGESVSEAFIAKWLKKDGDLVQKGEALVELETQKAAMQIESDYSGRLQILKKEGEDVTVGETIARIDDAASPSDGEVQKETRKDAGNVRQEKTKESESILSPSAQKMVTEKTLKPQDIEGTGKGGRIMKEDVVRHLEERVKESAATTEGERKEEAPLTKERPTEVSTGGYRLDEARGETRVRASPIRRQIAKNLVQAQQSAAILTTFNEVDMSAVLAYRKKNKEAFEKTLGRAPGIVTFFAMASARALKEFPMVNATFTGEDIIRRDFVDISIAVSTDAGLVVPVVRDAHRMGLVDFEKRLNELADKASKRKLSIPEMTGGTFTISNGGVFGSLLSTPLLNMPQSAILGLHAIKERPIAHEGNVVIRPMMYLALSYDHRIIDGREAVLFLVKIKEMIEKPELMIQDDRNLS